MRAFAKALLKLTWGGYLLFTSVYCLLAFLPYTYYALIKAPPYAWLTLLVHYHVIIYWILLLASVFAFWPRRKSQQAIFFGALVLAGAWLAWNPLLPTLENNWSAFRWSLIALLPLAVVAVAEVRSAWPRLKSHLGEDSLIGYSSGVLAAIAAALVSAAAAAIQQRAENGQWNLDAAGLELTGWSAVSHVVVAMIAVSLVNLVTLGAAKHRRGAGLRRVLLASLVWIAVWVAVARFLSNALSFDGWPAHLYAALLSATLVGFSASLVLPVLVPKAAMPERRFRFGGVATVLVLALLSLIALALPSIIQGGDWNGVLQLTFGIVFWVALTIGLYRLRSAPARYSASAVTASLLVTCFAYWALRESAIAWASPLGSTDDEIARAMEKYAARDSSFEVAHRVLGNGRAENCGDLCRILRQHTNIRDAEVEKESDLVVDLVPVQGERPNLFVFVIDSLRPDYLGAYQPRVDFTPNLDALARESVVFRNAYTQYAGTTLSEPAIWSGALLLHTHYMRPFERVNGLEKLVRANGYRMLVSYDTVLSQLLSPHDDLVRLDGDQPLWNGLEACSTLEQSEKTLDAGAGAGNKPVFFYAQPMNVHQFARNNQPSAAAAGWRSRPGFNNRIAHAVSQVDACLGRFFAYLKERGLYDNSIIVITSDHGDATGEFGRYSHSGYIYPEIIRVPLIVRLPGKMRKRFVYDAGQIAALTDITPSLYALLGYKAIQSNAVFGRPLFADSREELESYRREDLFLASDTRAVYGLLSDNGRFLYVTYDSPASSFLFDLEQDPNAEKNIVTDGLKKSYDRRIIVHLQAIADYYGYKPSLASLVESPKD